VYAAGLIQIANVVEVAPHARINTYPELSTKQPSL
jgi:hypothetical protein